MPLRAVVTASFSDFVCSPGNDFSLTPQLPKSAALRSDWSKSTEWRAVLTACPPPSLACRAFFTRPRHGSRVPFFVDDGTGQLLVNPHGAELDLHRDFRQTYSDTIFAPHAPPQVSNFLARHGATEASKVRIEERCIKPNDLLFIIGTMAENSGIEVKPSQLAVIPHNLTPTNLSLQPDLPVAFPEVIRLSEPSNPSVPLDITQQSKVAAALTMAGIVNAAAWTAAGIPYRGVTVADSPRLSQVSVNGDDESKDKGRRIPEKPNQQAHFNLTPPVVLMKGENDPIFVISSGSRHDLVRSLRWKSAAMIWLGAALMLLGIYVLLAHWQFL
ncbi:MAG: hypothetical protein DMG80_21035 [Acidobacteria bacterium]|nr:MAG: hypothetical protein DMG80_21035 [Acidobacteriota bacterium]